MHRFIKKFKLLDGGGLGLSGGLDITGAVDGIVVLTAELFEGLALGLGDAQGGGTAEKHEEGKDLEDVVQPRAGVGLGGTADAETGNGTLANDGANLARGGRDTVRGGTVAGGEDLTGDNEGGGVGAKVEEELGNDVDGEEAVGGELVEGEAHDDEENGQDDEATHLDGLAANGVNGGDGDPVARDGTGEDNDDVADGGVVEELVDVGDGVARGGETDGLENGTVVQGETVKGNVKAEPGASSSDEEEEVVHLAVVAAEVLEASLGDLESGGSLLADLGTGNLVDITLSLAADVGLDVFLCTLDIAGNIKGVSGGFGDGQTVYGMPVSTKR